MFVTSITIKCYLVNEENKIFFVEKSQLLHKILLHFDGWFVILKCKKELDILSRGRTIQMTEKKSTNSVKQALITVFAFIVILIVVFFLSYFCVSKLYSARLDKKNAQEKAKEEEEAQSQAEESAENFSFTMMYLDNEDTEKVDYCSLRAFNRVDQEMSIFMIPTDSTVTVSSTLKETLNEKADSEVPSEFSLSELGTYYSSNETKYEMIAAVVQELIGGVEIESYEALDYDSFVQVINQADPISYTVSQIVYYTDATGESAKLTPGTENEIDGNAALGILTYSDGFGSGDGGRIERSSAYLKEYVTSITTNYTKDEMGKYLSSYCSLIQTNGSIDEASSYVENCLKLDDDSLSFYTMKGTQKEEEYVLDAEKIQSDIKIVMGEDAYELATTEQTSETQKATDQTTESEDATAESEEPTTVEEISSIGKSITIYNGAYINGLAKEWKEKLTEAGYQIDGIYNYEGETLENGRIIVREEGMGEDLVRQYFPDAEIEVGTPDDGADIQIILGRSEDI